MFLFLALAAGSPSATSDRRWLGSNRWRWPLPPAWLAAMVFCTKETFGLVLGLALVLLVVTGWVVSRREAAVVLAWRLIGYAISVVAMGLLLRVRRSGGTTRSAVPPAWSVPPRSPDSTLPRSTCPSCRG